MRKDYGMMEVKWQDYYRIVYTGLTRAKIGVVAFELTGVHYNGAPSSKDILYYANFGRTEYKAWLREYSGVPSNLSFNDMKKVKKLS